MTKLMMIFSFKYSQFFLNDVWMFLADQQHAYVKTCVCVCVCEQQLVGLNFCEGLFSGFPATSMSKYLRDSFSGFPATSTTLPKTASHKSWPDQEVSHWNSSNMQQKRERLHFWTNGY